MADRHKKKGQVFRFSEETRFAVQLLARQIRGSQQDAFDSAILAAVERLDLAGHVWSDLYDSHPGVQMVRLLSVQTIVLNEQERVLRSFVSANSDFFYVDGKNKTPRRTYIEALWPQIDEFRDHWAKTHEESPKATRLKMVAALKAEGLPSPKA